MKLIAHCCLPVLLSISLVTPVLAADDGYSPVFSSCMDASGGVTTNMLNCIGNETTVQDARLNQAYKAAMQAIAPEQQTQLRDAQRLWIKYRDANCGLYGSLTGGTIDRINGAGCMLEMTRERAVEIEGIDEP
ncbi:lysozyme inhibitor LprI family protein [Pseudomonas sp. AN-1]|uniref:lysozyme inhibitor LprI family protein n=1 Tax=Pseudomonas sp. AN-1 TaxID=3096605 RepID=UPI002A6A6A3E|nr:lysozyme inhibitor LprI family protein [Pseudomonas sp. AN-1]WPP44501.1 lysozyme inhibitor LprI family protein [Pseudomonas sp. AN-1]